MATIVFTPIQEKVLTFKPHSELPMAFKHLTSDIPVGLTNVLVTGYEVKGSEIYLTVRFKNTTGITKKSVLNRRHFFNKGEFLIYTKRNKIKAQLN